MGRESLLGTSENGCTVGGASAHFDPAALWSNPGLYSWLFSFPPALRRELDDFLDASGTLPGRKAALSIFRMSRKLLFVFRLQDDKEVGPHRRFVALLGVPSLWVARFQGGGERGAGWLRGGMGKISVPSLPLFFPEV